MFKLLLWAFLLLVFITVIGFVFLLGLSFGLSNNRDKFITETVPVLSMLGGWVAGIGALAAVLTTLWLADKQRREDVESLRVSVRSAITNTGEEGWFIALGITSDGKRPVKVTGVSVQSPHARNYLHIHQFWLGSHPLPAAMTYGDSISLHLTPGFDRQINRYVEQYCRGNASGLKFVVSTTLHEFNASIDKNMLTLSD
ncbi:hypothetical protein [Pseudomonas trivialis]|uniref:Uncharacterized protein n=1 Tax=Pseudomonas trivialis TaxID=200450 RepID=A0A0R2ZEE2_9PSED|nr:hypothetical protein [Pseudomonas trivialis]KRP59080.1 hypothetical protein TU79_16760 [Pseudomonas trivialis]SDS70344.1 hypothetical protein SAMN04490205_3349 [Pseudomonas trivialis]